MNVVGLGFGAFGVMFMLMSLLFIGIFIFIIVKLISDNQKDKRSPVLSVPATVVTKRTHVAGDHAHTSYFATFQVPSGDRMELKVPHDHFGYLVEGDQGTVTFQGTRFLSFQRV